MCPLSPTRVYDDKGDERNDRSNTKKTLRQRLCVAADGWLAADDAPAATGAVRLQRERTRGGWRRSERSGIDGDRRSGDEKPDRADAVADAHRSRCMGRYCRALRLRQGDCLSGVWNHTVPSVGKERACGVSRRGNGQRMVAGRHELG